MGAAGLAGLSVLLMVVSGFNAAQWWDVRTTPDDGFGKVLAYLHQHVPHGHRVASTSETGQYVLQGYLSGPWGPWDSPQDLIAARPEFVLVTPRTVRWNDAHPAEPLLDWVDQNGTLMYVFEGRENNVLRLYRLPWASAAIRKDTPGLASRTCEAPRESSSGTCRARHPVLSPSFRGPALARWHGAMSG